MALLRVLLCICAIVSVVSRDEESPADAQSESKVFHGSSQMFAGGSTLSSRMSDSAQAGELVSSSEDKGVLRKERILIQTEAKTEEGGEGEKQEGNSKGEKENPEGKEGEKQEGETKKGEEGGEGGDGAKGEGGKSEGSEGGEGGEGAKGEGGKSGGAEGGEGGEGEKEGEGEGAEGGEGGEGEKEGEREGEGEEEKEEEEFSEVDISVACMLLGAVTFVMLLFYLVNFDDEQIRRYSWQTISTTLSIFLAVLIFTGINEYVTSYAEKADFGEYAMVAVQYLEFFVWMLILQFTIGYVSGAICEGPEGKEKIEKEDWVVNDAMRFDYESKVDDDLVRNKDPKATKSTIRFEGVDIPVAKKQMEYERRLRRMKCWATLFAHTTGFAAIHAGASMQELEVFKKSPAMAFIPVVINTAIIGVLFGINGKVRSANFAKAKQQGRAGLRAKMANEETAEAENDIMSLQLSFLAVLVVRYALTDVLPNHAGHEHDEKEKSVGVISSLGGFGAAAVAVTVILSIMKGGGEESEEGEEEEGEGESCFQRALAILMNTAAMMFAWSLLAAAHWTGFRIHKLEELRMSVETMGGQVGLALVLSLIAFCVIFLLDKIDDAFRKKDGTSGAIALLHAFINAIAILVGFSWEHAFDTGVEALASLTSRPAETELFLAAFVVILIVPAWRKYILKKVMQLKAYNDEKIQGKRMAETEDALLLEQ